MFNVIDGLGLAVLAPVASLVLASAALGDLAEDRTLVYVWLRPPARGRMATGALAAALAAALPVVIVPLLISDLIGGARSQLVAATLASATVAVVGYVT